jgi:UDPglucose--hexose-1-phosphate uridylyltransferase
LLNDERDQSKRVVIDDHGFVAFCPHASLQPCELWILPASHEPSFELAMMGDAPGRLSKILSAVMVRLESLIPAASFNLLLRTAPWRPGHENHFHWRIELLPRTNPIAGFESATGIFINPVAPERAAEQLRSA